jgi:hypothetical protein
MTFLSRARSRVRGAGAILASILIAQIAQMWLVPRPPGRSR